MSAEAVSLRERRLQIARRILAERTAGLSSAASPASPASPGPEEQVVDERRLRDMRAVLRSPVREAARFYARTERRLVETARLEDLLSRLSRLPLDRPPHLSLLTGLLVQGLQVRVPIPFAELPMQAALFNCSVRIGLLPDTGRDQIVLEDSRASNAPTLTRPSDCFECLDSRSLVVADTKGAPGVTVLVPIVDANEGIGVLELRGLLRAGESLGVFERSTGRLKSLLQRGGHRWAPTSQPTHASLPQVSEEKTALAPSLRASQGR